MAPVDVRKGMTSVELSREEFEKRYRSRFVDPAFAPLQRELDAITAAAWDSYSNYRKAPVTRKAGPGFADPNYDLSVDWLAARDAILAAQRRHDDASETPRILVINGSSRSDQTCPGEMSKTWRLVKIAEPVFQEMGFAVDILDLSRLTSEFGKQIHPCKACVSTSMALCHWPCSCYPNHSLRQVNDWMNDIYPRWVRAHAILIVTPVYWYQAPSGLKLMMDRLVCADGGNPDPTSTHGKDPAKAKELELKGWPYPRHLAGRAFSVIVHGDAAGAENLRRILTDWMMDIGMITSGHLALIDRYVGYLAPYATSHDDLDRDTDFQDDVRNAARALVQAVKDRRSGKLNPPDRGLHEARPK